MITQYSTGDVPAQVAELIRNKLGVMDEYILMPTGDSQYDCLIRNAVTKEVRRINVYRESSSYSSRYVVREYQDQDWSYSVTAEYYVYSNIGYGRGLVPIVYDGIRTYSLAGMCCALFLAIIFKGVLFRCVRKSGSLY
jgi:hypothetical protein